MRHCKLLWALLIATPAHGWAQDSVQLRYAPAFGTEVHRLFQSHTRMTTRISGDPGAEGRPTREAVDLGSMVQVALIGPSGERVVHLAFDSLRTRVREGPGPWRETRWSGLDSLWVQAWVDSRLGIERLTAGTGSPTRSLLLHLLTGLPNLLLPDRWVRHGDAWTVEHAVPVGGVVGRTSAHQPIDTLVARTVFRVDSLTARGSDTLAFLHFSGEFQPVQAAAGAVLSYGGGLAGSLVWSSGWNAFVSGAVRFRVTVRMRSRETAANGPREAVVTLETTTRHRVQSGS